MKQTFTSLDKAKKYIKYLKTKEPTTTNFITWEINNTNPHYVVTWESQKKGKNDVRN